MKRLSGPHGHATRHGLRGGFAVLAAVGLLSTFAAPAQAVGYTFTKVVDSTADGFQSFFGCPAMNNAGDVAFRGVRLAAGTNGIYRANAGGTITTIAENAKKFGFLGNNPSINDLGQVSFAARLNVQDKAGNTIENILRGDGKKLTTIASTADEFEFFVFDTTVNNSGEVAFGADLDNFDGGLFSSQGGKAPTTTHYLASTNQFVGSSGRPSINNPGEIAFDERTDANFDPGIFVTEGAGFKTILEPATHFFVDTPQLNDLGTAAFQTDFFDESGQQYLAIVTGNGGPLTTVADTRGPFASFGFPSLNNNGEVAFEGELDSAVFPAPEGIFVGPDPVADRVIGTGDVLDGEVVTGVRMCHEGLNDSGQIAFTAEFTDPVTFETRTAIYRATRN
jgi:hypothetical protein